MGKPYSFFEGADAKTETRFKRARNKQEWMGMNIWERIKEEIAKTISQESFENWFADTLLQREESERLFVRVPNESARAWMEQEYSETVRLAIEHLHLPIRTVLYEVASSNNGSFNGGPSAGNNSHGDLPFQAPMTQMNSKFNFKNFVVGSCNQFAHAAAMAVATRPSQSYNPLFIYGGVGMGKTHLMHAIGRHLLENFRDMKVVYTSSERFMNEMIQCIRTDRMREFHQHYRTADVLLVDDVQILGGKERTQEEFFHTFNELYDHQKQIVLSSDSPPKQTSGLVERLRSRFEWGLMVDVQPPDLETKIAILDRKAEEQGIHLPEDVRVFIATKTKSNMRELEGALIKLGAYSSVTQSPITLAMATQVLKHIVAGQDRRISIDSIIKVVGEHFQLTPAQIKQKSNARSISYPRQVAMYLAKDLTTSSLPEIGKAFGGKHHTTVLHSIGKIESLRQNDVDLNKLIHRLSDSIH